EPNRAIGALHLEEPVALDRDVELFPGVGELALGEDLRGRGDARTVADLDARRDEIAAAGIGARLARLLVKQILELDLAPLEAGGVHVGEVVRNRVQVELL